MGGGVRGTLPCFSVFSVVKFGGGSGGLRVNGVWSSVSFRGVPWFIMGGGGVL